MLDLSAVEQSLESAWLLGKLEQLLPLILGEWGLLGKGTLGVLGLALGLPLGDLCLLTLQGALVVLVVVQLGVVVLYAVEQEVAALLEERIDGEIERLKVRGKRYRGELRVGVEGSKTCGELQLGLLWGRSRELVEVRGEEVRVVHSDGQFGEDVLVTESALLQARLKVSMGRSGRARQDKAMYLSVVNLPSLYAAMN